MFEVFRAADLCYVGSLHDGMNLVAKEFVSARDDERGVLVLSEYTGAARELNDAVFINPLMSDQRARTLSEALTMSPAEQARRMRAMRAVVQRNNAYKWARDMLADAAVERTPSPVSARPRRRVSNAAISVAT